jgi:uncharacterized protein with NAD-binding domain and iron-sulfur cluster
MTRERNKVAIIGGGCAAMAAAFELTRPELQGRFDVTIYQMGFRLGGKGASGRGAYDRIEEHGLHLWMGFYENAFRLMRECYAELARDDTSPIATIDDAFTACPLTGMADEHHDVWEAWLARFPAQPGLPGDPHASPAWTVGMYLGRCIQLVRTLFESLDAEAGEHAPAPTELARDPIERIRRLVDYGALAGLAALREALDLLGFVLERSLAAPDGLLVSLLAVVRGACMERLRRLAEVRELRRLWQIIDLVFAVVRGCIRHRLLTDPRGFEAIDEYDCREWLHENGAQRESLDCALVRALYDLAFAYEHGDPSRPRIAAGQALRGALRAFFTYRGALFYRMNAGMGDVVFAPFYEVLARRGVRFAFFHRLTNLVLGPLDAPPHIAALELEVQAELRGDAYQPLIDVRGLPCWPNRPLYDQLVDGEALRERGWTGESEQDPRPGRPLRLAAGRDFDLVVLAVGVGAVPQVTRELTERDARWRAMLRRTSSVATQAMQLWLEPELQELGWLGQSVNLSGYVEPFDTWADMSHLAAAESWPVKPGTIAYFCSVLPDAIAQQPGADERVFEHARSFLDRDLKLLWPRSQRKDGGFDWRLLLDPARTRGTAPRRHPLHRQYLRANTEPSDRYALSLPGTLCFRVSPLDETYDNLSVCGDWTDCGFNEGCVEAAVMSGRLAAHAISLSPPLEDIIGYDHP